MLLAGLLAGCGGASEELEALRAEPLASATFDGLHLLREHERDAQDGAATVTGKAVQPLLTRVFAPDDATELPARLGDVVVRAGRDGWTETAASPTSFTGQRRLDAGTGQVQVVIAPCGSARCLYLYLTLL